MAKPLVESLLHPASDEQSSRPPILLVPGALSGSWLWRETFMPHFFQAGYDVHAMNFRGHGGPKLKQYTLGLNDFLTDLREVVDLLPRKPIIVAHSMGGLHATRLAAEQHFPGLLLLSAVPADGVRRSMLSLAKYSPVSAFKLVSAAVSPGVAKRGFAPPKGIFSAAVSPELVQSTSAQLQAESLRALTHALKPPAIDIKNINTPVHCYGATGDRIIPANEVVRGAELLGATYTIYDGMSHTFQAEPDWQQVADDMLSFINGQCLN